MISAKVLWFDEKQGNGIAIDNQDNEYYIDISAIPNRAVLSRGQRLLIKKNDNIKDCLCAQVITIL